MNKSFARISRVGVISVLSASLIAVTSCDPGVGFLGLQDYQRDLLVGGLLVQSLLDGDGSADPAATQGVPGADGADGLHGSPGADGASGAAGVDGEAGATGAEGPEGPAGPAGAAGPIGTRGSAGPDGEDGASGPAFFTIFIDDFFALDGNPTGDLSVNLVSISEPVLGSIDTLDAVAYRVAIPQIYDAGNDVTMRLYFLRTGDFNGSCFVFSLDAARLRAGESIQPYGERVWVRVDGSVNDGAGVFVDLVINSPAGLDYPDDLAISDFLAFELSTYRFDGGEYHLLGVEFYEFDDNSARSANATIFRTDDEVECECEGNGLDCNENDVPDNCDIESGTSDDCNENGIPDECEADCNENGVPDDCDIADETSQDCQPNGIPDECEKGGTDCEVTVVTVVNITAAVHGPPDLGFSTVDVDLEAGDWELVLVRPEIEAEATYIAWSFSFGNPGTWRTSWAAQLNDESLISGGSNPERDSDEEAWDATTNFVTKLTLAQADTLRFHIRDNALTDNRGGVSVLIRNECVEPGGGDPGDCNRDGVLDECQLEGHDCNDNGILDECDIAVETSQDCQPNGIPDECDIADGTSFDCDENGIPDECKALVVGRLDGTAGGIVDAIIADAKNDLTITVVTTGVLDAAFFSQIDVFVFANASGAFEYDMGSAARTNLRNFVEAGGHAYLGLDVLVDGPDIAALFGFTLADRLCPNSTTGTITDPNHAITTGPFQPAQSFPMSCFGRFNGAPPAGGSFIGTTFHGNTVAYIDAGALAPGSGKVVIFTDEVPLAGAGDHANLFKNMLTDFAKAPDCNDNGIPDECEETESLTGWWRFEFHAQQDCEAGNFEGFVNELRYLRFDENNELVENFIITEAEPVEGDPQCLQVFYPSDNGPNYLEVINGAAQVFDTHREITAHSFDPTCGALSLTELVDVPNRNCFGEEGSTFINAHVSGDTLTGTWDFQFSAEAGLFGQCIEAAGLVCGDVEAQRVDGPPECDIFNLQ